VQRSMSRRLRGSDYGGRMHVGLASRAVVTVGGAGTAVQDFLHTGTARGDDLAASTTLVCRNTLSLGAHINESRECCQAAGNAGRGGEEVPQVPVLLLLLKTLMPCKTILLSIDASPSSLLRCSQHRHPDECLLLFRSGRGACCARQGSADEGAPRPASPAGLC
jgi:hypothetical protein